MTTPTEVRALQGDHVPALDGWRGLAIGLVLVGHFWEGLPVLLAPLGVEFFFVLSGRLMADILFVRRTPLPYFFSRRMSRIVPALFAFVMITWLATGALGQGFSLLWVAAALTFTLNYALVLHTWTAWIDHVWSLCVEEHAYMLLGLVAFVGKRALAVSIWIMAVVAALAMLNGLVSQFLLQQDPFLVFLRSDVRIASIFISAFAYLALQKAMRGALLQRYGGWVSIVACLAGVIIHLWGPLGTPFTLGTMCLAISVALVDLVPPAAARMLSTPALRQLGVWSYSLYLWQQPFYKLTRNNPEHTLTGLAAAIACALASFYLVEQPTRRFLNRRIDERIAKRLGARAAQSTA